MTCALRIAIRHRGIRCRAPLTAARRSGADRKALAPGSPRWHRRVLSLQEAPMRPLLLAAALLAPAALHAQATIAAATQGMERRDGLMPVYWSAAKGRLY